MENTIPDYPQPAVPLSPIFSWYSTKLARPGYSNPGIFDCQYKLHLTSGRAAIALALEHSGVKEGDEVMVPAFHCESMVAPVRWLKATPVFYRINADASIDVNDISRKISSRTRAIIITHYFGFVQDLRPVLALCKQTEIKVLEDCAHAFFGRSREKSVGASGDYAIASSMKFFPVLDGGLLASNTMDISSIRLQPVPIAFQLKSFINSLERSIGYKRFGLAGRVIALLISMKEALWKVTKILLGRDKTSIKTPASSEGGQQLDKDWIRRKASLASKLILAHSDTRRVVELRRKNYQKLDKSLKNLPGCHPLHTKLDDDCVPLVYPLFVDHPDRLFGRLKKIGVPIWRFGEYLDKSITESVCANSVKLSAHVFQFPCHQELREEEINWIIYQVTNALVHTQDEEE